MNERGMHNTIGEESPRTADGLCAPFLSRPKAPGTQNHKEKPSGWDLANELTCIS